MGVWFLGLGIGCKGIGSRVGGLEVRFIRKGFRVLGFRV